MTETDTIEFVPTGRSGGPATSLAALNTGYVRCRPAYAPDTAAFGRERMRPLGAVDNGDVTARSGG